MKTLFSLALMALLGAAQAGVPAPHASFGGQSPEGLAPADWASIREARVAGLHAFRAAEGGYEARNPGQRWLARFDGRGFTARPDGDAWEWGLELRSYGFPGEERQRARAAAVAADGQRLTYAWDACLQEWFVNDARGLEHGYTVARRPGAPNGSDAPMLSFNLAVRGGLAAHIAADGQSVQFRDERGGAALDYGGLKVWDADGAILPAHFEQAGAGLRLLVDERGARYPLIIDPIAQQAHFKGDNTEDFDDFGWSVAISGDTMVVGAKDERSASTGINSVPNNDAPSAGAAYVFVRNGSTWTQQAYLKASNAQVQDYFGDAVAISGDTIVVGAPEEDGGATGVNGSQDNGVSNSGAAYVFVRSGTTWTQQAYLKAHNTGTGDSFGGSVAISGDTIVVGAWEEDSNSSGVNGANNSSATNSGAAYVFTRSGTTWTQQAFLKSSHNELDQRFGAAVAISGDTAAIGAYAEDSTTSGINSVPDTNSTETGAVFVFVRNGATWTQQAFIKAHNPGAEDRFGWAVAISGDTIVAGAYSEDSDSTGVNSVPNENASVAGAAYVFARSGTTWTQQAYLKASNAQADGIFGRAVAIDGDTVVVGAYQEDSSSTGVNSVPNMLAVDAGAAYTFYRNGSTWTPGEYLKASHVGVSYEFGYAVGVSGETVVVGAHWDLGYEGGVYVFGELSSLQAWRQNHFGSPNNAGESANDFDFDSDGWTNLVEYGVVGDPTAHESGIVILGAQSYAGGERLRAVFTRDPARSDVTIRVEVSGSLAGPWTTVASSVNGAAAAGLGLVSETDVGAGLMRVEARDTVPYTNVNAPSRFLRIVVVE